MSTPTTVKAQLRLLLNNANETTGNTDTNLTDGVNALVSGYGQGGSSGSLEGLENGYDVMFYKEDNEALAFYSIKQGQGINPPVYTCKNWIDQNGTAIVFPYTPTADLTVYANNETAEASLYEHFGINPSDYPYLCVYSDGNGIKRMVIVFSTSLRLESDNIYFNGYWKELIMEDVDLTNMEEVVNRLITGLTELYGVRNTYIKSYSPFIFYVNEMAYNAIKESTVSGGTPTFGRLDQ